MTEETKEKPPTIKEMIDDLGHLIGQQQDFQDEAMVKVRERIDAVAAVLSERGRRDDARDDARDAKIDQLEDEIRWGRRTIERLLDRALKLAPASELNEFDTFGNRVR